MYITETGMPLDEPTGKLDTYLCPGHTHVQSLCRYGVSVIGLLHLLQQSRA